MAGYFSKDAREARRQKKLNKQLFSDNFEKVKRALDQGADVHFLHPQSGYSPLYYAVGCREKKIAVLLLEHDADPDIASSDKEMHSIIHEALCNDDADMAQMLLDAGADIHRRLGKRYDRTCFHAAAGKVSTAKVALGAGLDINARDEDGQTPLHYAAAGSRKDTVEFLLANGADPCAEDKHGKTPIEHARDYYPQIKRVLQEAMERVRKQAEQKQGVQAVARHEGWHRISDDEIWHVEVEKDMGYSFTRIFNFRARTFTQIARNLETNAESQTLASFEAVDDGSLVQEAMAAMEKEGGKVDLLRQDKPRLGSAGAVF